MPFCPKCGYKLNEGDQFCYSCGNKIDMAGRMVLPQTTHSPNESSGGNPSSLASDGKAYLLVACLASSPHGKVWIRYNDRHITDPVIKAGETLKIPFEPGDYILNYTVDRGPGLTFVASRITNYQHRVSFHPGETVTMDAHVGHQVTNVYFQSDRYGMLP